MSHDKISSRINCSEKGIDRLLEAATAESRRISHAIQKIAGTTSCKGVQIHGLKKWAIKNQAWITDITELGEFSDRGSENEVYMFWQWRDTHDLVPHEDTDCRTMRLVWRPTHLAFKHRGGIANALNIKAHFEY